MPFLVFLNVYGIDSSLMVQNILRAQTEAYGLSLRKCFDTSSSKKSPLLRITMMLTVWKLERNYSISEKFHNVNIRCRIRYVCSIGLPYCFIYSWIDNSIFMHRLKRWKLLFYVYILSTYSRNYEILNIRFKLKSRSIFNRLILEIHIICKLKYIISAWVHYQFPYSIGTLVL